MTGLRPSTEGTRRPVLDDLERALMNTLPDIYIFISRSCFIHASELLLTGLLNIVLNLIVPDCTHDCVWP